MVTMIVLKITKAPLPDFCVPQENILLKCIYIYFFHLPKLPWPGYQNRFAVDPRIMGHPAAMAYNFNLLQPPNRGSPIPYSGVAHPSPLGLAQPSPDKEPSDPIRNGLP